LTGKRKLIDPYVYCKAAHVAFQFFPGLPGDEEIGVIQNRQWLLGVNASGKPILGKKLAVVCQVIERPRG
jgi:hypothetical protein